MSEQAVYLGVLAGCVDKCVHRPYGGYLYTMYSWVSVYSLRLGVCTGRAGDYVYRPYG